LRPKQTDLISDKGQFRSRFHHPLSYVVRQRFFWIHATDTDIISAQHFWTGRLERLGRCGRDSSGGGVRMLVMCRIRHAAIVP
jgi:hypothetical protein